VSSEYWQRRQLAAMVAHLLTMTKPGSHQLIIITPLPSFYIIKLFNITHIYIYVNETRYVYNIDINVDSAKKSYNMKRKKVPL
jgi:hypothetical protein